MLQEVVSLLERMLSSIEGDGSIQGLLIRWNISDFLEHLKNLGENSIAVTSLVYCSHKFHLQKQHPIPTISQNLYAPWATWGRLVHLGLQSLIKSYWRGAQVEVEVAKGLVVDDREVVVHGRIDAIVHGTVYEFKSSRSDTDLPKPHHVLQLRIYMNLAKATKGVLVYLTPDRITEYTIENPMTDNELRRLVMETINDYKHPRWDWECQYCPFAPLCPYKKTNTYSKRLR